MPNITGPLATPGQPHGSSDLSNIAKMPTMADLEKFKLGHMADPRMPQGPQGMKENIELTAILKIAGLR